MSMFEIRNSRFVVFSVLFTLQESLSLPGYYFVVHDDVSRRMICWKTFTNSFVEAKASEIVREKFAVASKHNRTMKYGGKSKYITNLGTRNYRVLHLAYNPCPEASGCVLGLQNPIIPRPRFVIYYYKRFYHLVLITHYDDLFQSVYSLTTSTSALDTNMLSLKSVSKHGCLRIILFWSF